MIYFIQAGARGHIKIGYIKDQNLNAFVSRLKTIQTGNPQEFNVLLIIPGNTSVERKIHKMFDNCRCDTGGGTEWFEPTPELLEFIDSFTPEMITRVHSLERKLENTENRILSDIASKVFGRTPGGRSIKGGVTPGERKAKAKPAASSIKLVDLIDANVINAPIDVVSRYKSQNVKSTINRDGTLTYRGVSYKTPSAAASAARAFVSGVANPSPSDFPTNGWDFWHIVEEDGTQKPLSQYRR
jgi:hypothetical protein